MKKALEPFQQAKHVSEADVAALPARKRRLLEALLRGGTCVDKESIIHYVSCETMDCCRCKYVVNADTFQGLIEPPCVASPVGAP